MKFPTNFLITFIFLTLSIALMLTMPYYIGYTNERQSIGAFLPQAWSMEQWQHCWIVVPSCLFIIFKEREKLFQTAGKGSWIGLFIMLFSVFLYYVGFRVDNIYFGYAAIQIFIPSVVLWLLGWRILWHLAFPILFLAFAWPLFFLEEKITFPLRVIMSDASSTVLNILGVDVVRQGTGLISAPNPALGIPAGARFSVDVADPCSGIRSLFALMMVSALYGHFTLQGLWKKWALFLSSIPLAILGNLARILVLTFGTIAFGSEFAIGRHALTDPSWFHMAAGYLVFIVALAGMLCAAWILNHWQNFPAYLKALYKILITQQTDPEVKHSNPPSEKKEEFAGSVPKLKTGHYQDEY